MERERAKDSAEERINRMEKAMREMAEQNKKLAEAVTSMAEKLGSGH